MTIHSYLLMWLPRLYKLRGIFRNTELYDSLISDELYLPDPLELPESQNTAWNFTDELTKRFL